VSVFSLTLLFSELEIEFTCAHLHLLDALLEELYKSSTILFYVLPMHNLSSKVFSNLEAPL
jgi:hypothetical protein